MISGSIFRTEHFLMRVIKRSFASVTNLKRSREFKAPRVIAVNGKSSRLGSRSPRLTELQYLLDFADGAGGGVGFSVFQQDEVFAFKHGLEFLDLVDVDDDRTADAQEPFRREVGFQRAHGFA